MNQKESDSVLYSGFMVKSPPEKRLGPWKIFRASCRSLSTDKWKRRFFVLSKPAGSLPGQYLLSYYTDESCKRKKGYIDLEQCEQIIESLECQHLKNVFSINTFHKHKKRTYYLATDTEDDMTTWVRYLCVVCGLKQENKPEDIPPQQQWPVPVVEAPSVSQLSSPVQSQPPAISNSSHILPSPSDNSPYLYLNECKTGKSSGLTDSDGPRNLSIISDDDPHSMYDFPKSRDSVDDGLYKVPPRRSPSQLGDGQRYDTPPNHKGASPRSSSSESQAGDSAYSSDQMYQSPPPPRQYSPSHENHNSDLYDSPPPPRKIINAVPERPPKPVSIKTAAQRPHVVSLDIKVPSIQRMEPRDDNYDVPPSNESINPLLMSPPPPVCPNSAHKYVNSTNQEAYLQMGDQPPRKCPGGNIRQSNISTDSSYVNLDGAPPPRASGHNSAVYADMSGKDIYADMSSGRCSSLYQSPAVCPRPVTSSEVAPVPPPRPPATTKTAPPVDEDTYTIFSSERTKSFKKSSPKDSTNHISTKAKLPLPTKRGGSDPAHQTESSSSDDDEEEDEVSIDSSATISSKQSGSSGNWRHQYPGPRKAETELKYLDLDLRDLEERDAVKIPPIATGGGNLTEYREIDFVKTQALSDTKRFVDVQRKSNTESLQ